MKWIWISALLIACRFPSSEQELRRIELPGFSLEVPPYVQAPSSPAYADGEITGQTGLRRIDVSWSEGAIAEPAALGDMIEKQTREALAEDDELRDMRMTVESARTIDVNGHAASRIDARIDLIDMTVVDITCGRRSVSILAMSLANRRLLDRMLASFVCKPIEAEEQRLAAP